MEPTTKEREAFEKQKPLTLKEKLAFCSGDIFCGGNQALLSVIYLSFLTEIIHIPAFYAGLVVMVSKLWDAFTDPMVGILSDNTRTRFGRRRPYLFLAGLLIIPAMAFMWYPFASSNEAEKIVFMAVSYMVYYTVSTLVAVPYSSLSTEITTDVKTRSKVNLTRLLFSLSSTALCTLIPSLLFNLVRDNKLSVDAFYWTIVLGFGFFFTIPVLIAGIFSRERAPYPSAKSRFSLSAIFLPFRVKAFRKLLILYLAQAITMDIVTATVYYYAHYVVMINSTVFLACFLAVQVLAFPLVNYLVGKVSKVKIYRFLLPLTLLGAAGIGFYPASWPAWGLYVLSGITAVGFAGAQIMPWIIFPDVVDIGVLSFKERNAGVFSSGMTLIRKISSALALAIVGGILSLAGYLEPPNENPPVFLPQPDSAIWGIRMTIFLSFAVFMSIAYIISFTFKLTPEVSEKVKLLNEKHTQNIPLSEEEKTEEEKILKEYAK